MPNFQHVKISEGDLVEIENRKPVTGDRPIIGMLRGDGIGLDIVPAMHRVSSRLSAENAKSSGRRPDFLGIRVGGDTTRRVSR